MKLPNMIGVRLGGTIHMKHFLISVALLILVAHNALGQGKVEIPSGWKLISGCTVSVSVPPDTEFIYDHSSDACLRYYRGKNIAVRIYVTPFNIGAGDYSNWPGYCVVKTKINAREAEIVTSYIPVTSEENNGLDYTAMLLVPRFRIGSGNLIIRTWSKSPEERDNAIKILQSVQFDKN
jgi:hypothetical protein